ncbi:hypothetical protein V5N11_006118 [Cardamine amara subsp. amara]|uniref:Uncharacterized protein n=1 Tax=Cardamine amara subsp. amara TaxID=228776 RepID=A0ABD0Z6S8_CARAN
MEDLLANEERLTRIDSVESNGKKRVRNEFSLDSLDVKRLRDDLFDDSGLDPSIQDLDSVMKSFEDELSTATAKVSGETQPDLGYLFEASDDELGLPPPPPLPLPPMICLSSKETEETVTELVRASSDLTEVGELCGFEDHVTGFGSFDLGDGLFEYSDDCLDSGDLFSWRPESLPAE